MSPMRRRGFTLVELSLIVAIIGVLVAIAVPSFRRQVLMSRRAEAPLILDGIGTAELAYHAEHEVWVEAESNPGDSLDSEPTTWSKGEAGWTELAYEPDGPVRCNYMAFVYNDGGWCRADAYCDVDNDNRSYILRYYVPSADPEQERDGYYEVNALRF